MCIGWLAAEAKIRCQISDVRSQVRSANGRIRRGEGQRSRLRPRLRRGKQRSDIRGLAAASKLRSPSFAKATARQGGQSRTRGRSPCANRLGRGLGPPVTARENSSSFFPPATHSSVVFILSDPSFSSKWQTQRT